MLLIKNSSNKVAILTSHKNIFTNLPILSVISLLLFLIIELGSSAPTDFQNLSNIGSSKLYAFKSASGYANVRPTYDGNEDNNRMKRSWQSLQNSWGKRSKNVIDINLEHFDESSNLLGDSGEQDPENPEVYNKNNINYSEIYSLLPEEDEVITLPKRAWKNLNSGWGKRRSTNNDWNKFRGSWGKREPAWNNLKGLWGKRSENWNKLQPAWGKREQN